MEQKLNYTRPFTKWAANQIEKNLVYNDNRGKGAWETCQIQNLKEKIDEEYKEVLEAYSTILCFEENSNQDNIEHLQHELCDLAVTCFMLSALFDAKAKYYRRGYENNDVKRCQVCYYPLSFIYGWGTRKDQYTCINCGHKMNIETSTTPIKCLNDKAWKEEA